jgi:hypothetical protein
MIMQARTSADDHDTAADRDRQRKRDAQAGSNDEPSGDQLFLFQNEGQTEGGGHGEKHHRAGDERKESRRTDTSHRAVDLSPLAPAYAAIDPRVGAAAVLHDHQDGHGDGDGQDRVAEASHITPVQCFGHDPDQREVKVIRADAVERDPDVGVSAEKGKDGGGDGEAEGERDEAVAGKNALDECQRVDDGHNRIADDQQEVSRPRHDPFSERAFENEQDQVGPDAPFDVSGHGRWKRELLACVRPDNMGGLAARCRFLASPRDA